MSDETTYSKFLVEVETELNNIEVKQDQEKKILEVITEELMKALSYKPEERPNMKYISEKLKQENKICENCLDKDKKKVTLECGHDMCERCILKYVLDKFDKKEKYNRKVICSRCKEIKELSNFITISNRIYHSGVME
jgi:hypothetical protein